MPIYEYECSLCHFHFERRQRFDEEPAAICPKCQGKARRVLHSIPVIFKGSGFYITDNRKGGTVEKAEKRTPDKGNRKEK
ncbi:MAG TPA: FmdB family zinc ribbon protein [Dehalococcoidia bacterium]|nr:FmdB family zinc ribbon protein [Dehalococcoidia bacterium]